MMRLLAAKILSKLREKKGVSMFTPIVAVLIGTMFLLLLCNFIYLYTMVMGISDYTQQAILQTATSNAFNAYKGVREGNSTASFYAGNSIWQSLVSTSEMSYRLQQMLGMERVGNSLYKYHEGGSLRYAITNINVSCTNVAVASDGNSVTLTFTTTLTAEIPMTFLGAHLDTTKQISLKSYYTPMF